MLGITKWMIDHGLAKIEVRSADGNHTLEDVYILVVLSKGKEIMGKLSIEIQTRKSIADGKGAEKFYNELTTPPDKFWETELRDLVIKKKQPCKIFVQPDTIIVNN
ncbi:hypothetical protein KEM48_010363 [Puccinia striiformis f. sp. tritici PST-130]|nr:hypothetical protein KEM48_010363 [Puccinia striiformis f. sp. tritici PST-130]